MGNEGLGGYHCEDHRDAWYGPRHASQEANLWHRPGHQPQASPGPRRRDQDTAAYYGHQANPGHADEDPVNGYGVPTPEDGRRFLLITSETDRDLARRKSFADKDQAVVAKQGGKERDLLQWVNHLGIAWSCRKGCKGSVGSQPNQDSFSVMVCESQFALYGVYDGHGPHGHHASDAAMNFIQSFFLTYMDEFIAEPEKLLLECFEEAHTYLEHIKEFDTMESGTTCTLALHNMFKDVLFIAHVGDSRAVLGASKHGVDLTVDHKPELPKERRRIESSNPPGLVVKDGPCYRVFARGARGEPLDYPTLNMSRSLGDVDGHKAAGMSAVPDIQVLQLAGMRKVYGTLMLLLCSDGVWEFVSSQEAARLVSQFGPQRAAEAAKALWKESQARWLQESGGEERYCDDITSIVAHL